MNINYLLTLTAAMFFTSMAFAQNPFITVWNSSNVGVSDSTQIIIPTTGTGYDYDISWEDTSNTAINGSLSGLTGNDTVTFPAPGVYRVSISGDFPQIYFNNAGDNQKLILVEQWGDIVWRSMYRAFSGCYSMDVIATDNPDLSNVLTLERMFLYCNSLVYNETINNWDVSHVESLVAMFTYANSFNQNIGNWDVSHVKNMTLMFQSAHTFNQDIGDWDVSNVESMYGMFYWPNVFNQDISRWDVSNVTNMSYMFLLNRDFNQDITGWDVCKVTQMKSMFRNASAFDQNLSSWDIGKVTTMESMLNHAGLSRQNYDATLLGWAELDTLQPTVILGALGMEYCASEEARQSLIDNHDWTISGDQKDCLIIDEDIQTFGTVYGTPSVAQVLTLEGSSMTSCVWVVPPTGYEVGRLEEGPFADSIMLSPSNGNLALTDVLLRLKAPLSRKAIPGAYMYINSDDFGTDQIYLNYAQIGKAPLSIIADNKHKVYGDTLPPLTLTYDGFVLGETIADINPASVYTSASVLSDVDIYTIVPSGGYANDYIISKINGELAITPAPLIISADSAIRNTGEANPTFELIYDGFKNDDDASDLGCIPLAESDADISSPQGTYDIAVKNCGFTNSNYDYQFSKGILTVSLVTSASDDDDNIGISFYPNPSNGVFDIQLDKGEISKVTLYNALGQEETFYTQEINTKLHGPLMALIETTNGEVIKQKIQVVQ